MYNDPVNVALALDSSTSLNLYRHCFLSLIIGESWSKGKIKYSSQN